jgi:hypothetical protein
MTKLSLKLKNMFIKLFELSYDKKPSPNYRFFITFRDREVKLTVKEDRKVTHGNKNSIKHVYVFV